MEIKEESTWSVIQMIFAGLLFAAFGFGALGWVVYSEWVQKDEVALQHETWTQVPAHVLSCRVNKAAARPRNQSEMEWLQVRYSYKVNGIRFESDEVGSMDHDRLPLFREASQKALATRTEPASFLPDDLCCYVNPMNPRDVKLFTDSESSPWWWMVILFCFYGGIGMFGLIGEVMYLREAGRRIKRFFCR